MVFIATMESGLSSCFAIGDATDHVGSTGEDVSDYAGVTSSRACPWFSSCIRSQRCLSSASTRLHAANKVELSPRTVWIVSGACQLRNWPSLDHQVDMLRLNSQL